MARLFLILVIILISIVSIIAVVIFVPRLLLVALLEIPIELVDSVVCQMDVHVVKVGVAWLLVRLRGKPRETLLVNEDAKRIEAVEEYVETKIVLEALNQVRVRKVVLDDPAATTLSRVLDYLVEIARQENTFALSQVVRLDDERLPSENCSTVLVNEVVPEFARFQRQDPRSRKELELVGEGFLYFDEVAREVVLAADALDAWVLVHFLIRLHFGEEVSSDASVVPGDVPIFGQLLVGLAVDDPAIMVLLVLLESESARLLRRLLHDIVVCAVNI